MKTLVSEKVIEATLRKAVEVWGGKCIKLLPSETGLPDRLVLLPGGVMFFVETKSTGDKPSPRQQLVHRRLRSMGFRVEVCDTFEKLTLILNSL